ncbi:lysine--tRNA ligase [Aliarcobacter skirrowii]|uniref:lysine--tRNA ligase n=1 Tax=Aliarcobacter skirrowii TaxID=28200 RepID=UPI0008365DCD|nr:lysine--tRNA ligase [Aliarcobacter skirrowii]MDD3025517.1 lysine--tRNA ligase [Aliarcobacter skirrowii]
MFENRFIQQRIEKAENLRNLGINPYPNDSKRDCTIAKYLNVNSDVFKLESKRDENRNYTISGRIKLFRLMGKASFLKIEDESGVLQVYVARDNLEENFYNDIFKKFVEVGDIVEVSGYPFVTGHGELSLLVTNLKILTKAISPLPEKYHGIQDKELRYRQRYLDLIMNSEVRKTFHIRSKVISLTRRFFEAKGFLEVETPMMHPIAGGANAKPFVTHHNALGIDRFLRIAPELYLKRLIVGGFEAVFEINRNFRNEGMDATHNPEFTSIEFYWAYKTYEDLIELTIEYFEYLFENLDLPKILPYGDFKIDFNKFTQIPLIQSLYEIGGVPQDIVEDKEKILEFLRANKLEANSKLNLGQLQGELFDEFVEAKLINPTFITEYPVDISPLARRNDAKPHLTERFELFIAGKEIANAFSELNDPLDQLGRFEAQMAAKDSGDDEAHEMDEDFVNALSYGMAPTAGQGIGIDRLVMMLTNQHSIRDVLLFPAMKPVKQEIDLHSEDEEK